MMKSLTKYFTENKLLTVIIGILFMALSLYIFEISFTYKSLLLSRVLPFISFTMGLSFFRLGLFIHTDSSLRITVFKTFILLCVIILTNTILDSIKISTNLRSIIIIAAFCLLPYVLWKTKNS